MNVAEVVVIVLVTLGVERALGTILADYVTRRLARRRLLRAFGKPSMFDRTRRHGRAR